MRTKLDSYIQDFCRSKRPRIEDRQQVFNTFAAQTGGLKYLQHRLATAENKDLGELSDFSQVSFFQGFTDWFLTNHRPSPSCFLEATKFQLPSYAPTFTLTRESANEHVDEAVVLEEPIVSEINSVTSVVFGPSKIKASPTFTFTDESEIGEALILEETKKSEASISDFFGPSKSKASPTFTSTVESISDKVSKLVEGLAETTAKDLKSGCALLYEDLLTFEKGLKAVRCRPDYKHDLPIDVDLTVEQRRSPIVVVGDAVSINGTRKICLVFEFGHKEFEELRQFAFSRQNQEIGCQDFVNDYAVKRKYGGKSPVRYLRFYDDGEIQKRYVFLCMFTMAVVV
ncbi:MAG: hypothetical protein RL094_34 [Candidatus Parcubacteria bacterium]